MSDSKMTRAELLRLKAFINVRDRKIKANNLTKSENFNTDKPEKSLEELLEELPIKERIRILDQAMSEQKEDCEEDHHTAKDKIYKLPEKGNCMTGPDPQFYDGREIPPPNPHIIN